MKLLPFLSERTPRSNELLTSTAGDTDFGAPKTRVILGIIESNIKLKSMKDEGKLCLLKMG